MNARRKLAIGTTAVVLALGGGGAAIAGQQQEATPDDADGSSEQQATGVNVEKAKRAALEHTGEGRVTGAEVGDEESYYEIEVTRDDGSQVDVQLDRGFEVVEQTDDDEGPDGANEPEDD